MNKLCLLSSFLFFFSLSPEAMANYPIKNGQITINVSGSDASGGYDGDDAGRINLNLSYADAEKRTVKLSGDANSKPFSQVVSLVDLKKIALYAIGGDGGHGYDGNNGYNGSDGMNGSDGYNGSDGCPPTNGSNGSSGTNGSDGTSGGDGGNGGDGGDGGKIRITSSASESELLLLVTASAASGDGGTGGTGGRGGSGGRAGTGGRAGVGGRNTCDPVGSNGSDGYAGSDGYSGSNGRDGSNGYSGSDGRRGSIVFTTTSEAGSNNYEKAFDLSLTSAKLIDENEDSVFEPGEKVFLTQVTVTNNSSMPSPLGQLINLQFKDTQTLLLEKAIPVTIDEIIAPNTSKVLDFTKGSVVFNLASSGPILGVKPSLTTNFRINLINFNDTVNVGKLISWPVSLTDKTEKINGYFGDELKAKYTLKNVSTKDIGPSAEKSIEATLTWNSKTIPGSDVTVVLPDGQTLSLSQAHTISDLKIKAESTLELALKVIVKNSKDQNVTEGTLQLAVALKNAASGKQVNIFSERIPARLVKNIRSLAIDKTIEFKDIKCTFPNTIVKRSNVIKLGISKKANSEVVQYIVYRKMLLATKYSPWVRGNAFDFAPHYGILKTAGSDKKAMTALLNTVVVGALRTSPDNNWFIENGSCAID